MYTNCVCYVNSELHYLFVTLNQSVCYYHSMINHLRTLRQKRKISVEQLAEKAGVSRQHIYMLERGERRLNETLISRFSKILECEPSELLTGRKISVDYDSLDLAFSVAKDLAEKRGVKDFDTVKRWGIELYEHMMQQQEHGLKPNMDIVTADRMIA